MQERSGPHYERSVTRGRAGSAAWNAAGRPRKVTAVSVPIRDADGSLLADADGEPQYETRWYVAASIRRKGDHRWKHGLYTRPDEWVEATPEQVAAWKAWQASRP